MTDVQSYARNFEELYLGLRSSEGRLYPDSVVASLPNIDADHSHYKEWRIRERSSRRFVDYLGIHKRMATILEVGCGNGWLCHLLAKKIGTGITGLDINSEELEQAKRVFGTVSNIEFEYGDILEGALEGRKFDVIIFASCIQYFPYLDKVLEKAIQYLNPKGEIHILDSHFYTREEKSPARKRSLDYFVSKGFPEMIDYYFHHSLSDLAGFKYQVLHDPNSFFQRISRSGSPFYWLVITGKEIEQV